MCEKYLNYSYYYHRKICRSWRARLSPWRGSRRGRWCWWWARGRTRWSRGRSWGWWRTRSRWRRRSCRSRGSSHRSGWRPLRRSGWSESVPISTPGKSSILLTDKVCDYVKSVPSLFVTKQNRKVINNILPTHSTILKRPLMLFRYPVLRFILNKWSTLKLHNCQQSQNTAAAMHWLSRLLYCETAGGRRWQSPLPALPLATPRHPNLAPALASIQRM